MVSRVGVRIRVSVKMANAQLSDMPTRGLDNRQTGHLTDRSTHGLHKSRSRQLVDAASSSTYSFN